MKFLGLKKVLHVALTQNVWTYPGTWLRRSHIREGRQQDGGAWVWIWRLGVCVSRRSGSICLKELRTNHAEDLFPGKVWHPHSFEFSRAELSNVTVCLTSQGDLLIADLGFGNSNRPRAASAAGPWATPEVSSEVFPVTKCRTHNGWPVFCVLAKLTSFH